MKFNGAYPKHKISVIVDKNARVTNMDIFSGNKYDSKIFTEQLKIPSLIHKALKKTTETLFWHILVMIQIK